MVSSPPDIHRKRLTALWSRDVDPSRLAGRTKMIQMIREEISANYRAEHLRLRNVLEERRVRAFATALFKAVQSLLSGSLPSLQCLLFCDSQNHDRIIQHLQDDPPDILYCDGVRSFYFLKRLGRMRHQMRIVVDFDDLMSRRMQSLADAEIPLSLGYLHEKLPGRLKRAISFKTVSKAIARYEQAALMQVENQIGNWADAAVLISSLEAESLQKRYKELHCKATVYAIPPQVAILRTPKVYTSFSRFIFIGTDTLPQNKLTIQRILGLWRTAQPEAEIHLFGHMASVWPAVPGVVFRGYAANLSDVYSGDCALFSPGVLRGGLKTKVLEAFAFGCAVIGNPITFEGLHLNGYPLQLDKPEEIEAVLRHPDSHLQEMSEAAVLGQNYLRAFVGRDQFQTNWREVLEGPLRT
jgi:glycosyltransferase involved in cell wall biosynthesis